MVIPSFVFPTPYQLHITFNPLSVLVDFLILDTPQKQNDTICDHLGQEPSTGFKVDSYSSAHHYYIHFKVSE